ncbi:hypothetical protein PsorP6_005580 [Peronosclerospora sorghi]|uniref:Uncharacterized protein n=1 Tax=Peronosclerospora sorghi TaxID=230839 RepID=A0ACC0W5W9_9STRA|nr:hypothetical protein PsorP6_005580 [Peronosclerospora sorghi]
MAELKGTTMKTEIATSGDNKITRTDRRATKPDDDFHSSLDECRPCPSSTRTMTSLLTAYETWVYKHSSLARNVETIFYVTPQLMPKRFVEPNVATQFGYTLVGLLHSYHDYVLWKKSSIDKVEHLTKCQQLTRFVRVPLSLILHVQVLAEVLARKVGGDVSRWRVIVWVEVIKSVLRLVLLAQRRRTMLLLGGKYKGVESASQPSVFTRLCSTKRPGARTGKIFGKASDLKQSTSKIVDENRSKITFEDATTTVAGSLREELLVAGEICHILRPVMYALLRRRRTEASWLPLVASLLMECSGLAFSLAALNSTEPTKPTCIDKAKDEIGDRKMALFLYLLRDPVFMTVTKPAAGKVADVIDYVPGVGKLFRFGLTAILDHYHQFYFYTSVS